MFHRPHSRFVIYMCIRFVLYMYILLVKVNRRYTNYIRQYTAITPICDVKSFWNNWNFMKRKNNLLVGFELYRYSSNPVKGVFFHFKLYIHTNIYIYIYTYIFIFADPAIPPRSVEVLSANVSVHNGRLSTTGHPVLLSVNSMDNGPPSSHLQPTAPPSYSEYESYSTPFPLDETPEPPCIYTPSDDDNPMSEVRVVYHIAYTVFEIRAIWQTRDKVNFAWNLQTCFFTRSGGPVKTWQPQLNKFCQNWLISV